jgi:transcriptional regulator with XRE-family HTH domain
MAAGQGPTTVRRRLSAELRRLRKRAGLAVDDVAARLEWSGSKLVRIEAGQVGVAVLDLGALLQIYEVTDTTTVEELKSLARASRQQTWWGRFQRYLPPGYPEFIGAEFDAAEIHHYHPTTIPGLLQTRDYAQAIIAATDLEGLSPDQAQARTEVRMQRQQHVLLRADPPQVTAMLDEAVLRRPVGDAQVMRAQLGHLVSLATTGTVSLVVLPLAAGPHGGLNGAFTLMRYEGPNDDDVVCLENASGLVVMRDQPKVVERYQELSNHLIDRGLRDQDAIDFIQRVLD